MRKKPKIQALLGEKAGQQLYRYARGLDDSPVKMKPDEAKGFSLETTFNDDLVSMEQALPILLEQCDVLAARMRRKKKKMYLHLCNLSNAGFPEQITPDETEKRHRHHRRKLFHARKLFEESWRGQPLRLLGGITYRTYRRLL